MDTDDGEWASEPIAVIGMSCKFSGGASNPEKLWDLLAAGKTGWSEIPTDRFDLGGVYHPNNERPSTTHVKGGHFLDEDIAAFDAAFFNYSAEVAQAVDPQFRLQMESTYEALENAGLSLSKVAGSMTSVFAGVFTHDYQEGIIRDEDRLPRFNVVGTWNPMSSNRISHFYDFHGASMTLETGCSTTLVALHQAIHTLRNREADMSVVTGANVMLNPDTFKVIGSLGMLSPDGRSYAFDSRANGYGRGEGVGTIIIKRLSDALADNDPIRAVIRETALNQDGKTDTITSPSGNAQAELMRECYRRAGLDPRGTQYFEAHGTGTGGDQIEARAMSAIFADGEGRKEEANFLRIGSVKTNVGHTEAASGLAAMVKGILCLEKGLIPPSVNFETPNPKIKFEEWRLKVATGMEQWPASLIDGPRRLSVNNFGYGGTNAHVILESAEPWTSDPDLNLVTVNGHGNGDHSENSNGHVNGNGYLNGNHHSIGTANESKLIILSARDERGCQQMISDFKIYLEKHRFLGLEASKQLLCNLSYTLGERRSLFQWIAVHQVRLEADGTLDAAIEAFDSPRFKPSRRPSDRPRIGMVFTGQGAQWYAMGRELLASYPIFGRSIKEAETHLRALGADWSLMEELQRDAKTTKVHATAISIPVCVALQIALVQLLKAWGIRPAAVTSHSSGEIAAAFAVGAMTHRQAIAAAYYRAVLAADTTQRPSDAPKGAMAAVGLGAKEVQIYLDRLTKESGKAVIACVNSPQSVTISGDVDAVQKIEDMCKGDDVFARRLKVQQAYHSHHMDPLAETYREHLRKEMARGVLQIGKQHLQEVEDDSDVIFSSAVTGGRMTSKKDIASPDHWVGSLVKPVQFVDALTDMVLGDLDDPTGRSVDVLLEVGPHTALGGPIRETLSLPEFEGMELPYWGCLIRDEHAGDSMRLAASNLFREGQPLVMSQINLPNSIYDEGPRVLTDLPSYPWNHSKRHWQEARVNRAIRERAQPPHELLGMPVAGNDPGTSVWRRMLSVNETPWIRDHMVQGSIVYPGSGYVCLAIEAASQLERAGAAEKDKTSTGVSGFRLRNVEFLFACVIPDSAEGVEIRTTLRPLPEQEISARGWQRFEVSSVTQDNRWTLHAQGMITVERAQIGTETGVVSSQEGRRPLSTYTRHKDPQDMFSTLRAHGIQHGPLFQNTIKIIQDGREARSVCDITISHEASTDTDPIFAAENTLLHPITLDAIVLGFYCTLPSVGALQEDPKLPHSVSSMWVSSHISHEIGRTLHCDTKLVHDDNKSGIADISVIDSQTDATILTIEGLECASLGRGSGVVARQDAANKGAVITSKWEQEVCTFIEWGPDLSLRQPSALAQIKKELTQSESDTDVDIAKTLQRACEYFAHDTLQALNAEDVAQLKEQAHLAKYYEHLQRLSQRAVKEGNTLDPDSKSWSLNDPERRRQVMGAAASQSVDGELICRRLGPLLPSILRGDLPVDSNESLHEYSFNGLRRSTSLKQLSELLRKVVHKRPDAHVLQIGSGEGVNATRTMLETLGTPRTPRVGRWHITELSTKSLEDSRAELTEWEDLIDFSQLDIEQSPAKQNFTLGSYDIVVIFQALRSTKDVTNVAANMRSLLKPGGTLLMSEITNRQMDVDFIFGLLPDWWQRPTLSVSSWDSVLQDAGFSGVDVEVHDWEGSFMHTNSVLLSTVPVAQDQSLKLSQINSRESFAVVTSNTTPPPSGLVGLLSKQIQSRAGTDALAPKHLVLEESKSDNYQDKICVFLGEIDEPLLQDLDAVRLEGLRAMVTQCSGLLWVTTGGAVDSQSPEHALSSGLLRVLRNEYIGRRYISLDLDPSHAAGRWSEDGSLIVSTIVQVLEEAFGRPDTSDATAEFEYAERDGVLLIPRVYKDEQCDDMVTGPQVPIWSEVLQAAKIEKEGIVPIPGVPLQPLFQESRPLRLEVGIPGHLDTLAYVDDMEAACNDEILSPEAVDITPRAYGLSSRDVIAAMGQVQDRSMGCECSGIITRLGAEAQAKGYKVGDRVLALSTNNAFASCLRVPWHNIARLPGDMSFESAASLPLAFTLAYTALIDAVRLSPGQSLLVHAAAGAFGQAVIILAKHLGVTDIYATVGSQEKRTLIEHEFDIPVERIFSSQDSSFASAIMIHTKGRGVDVVFNSLTGALLQASLSAIAPMGHLINIGQGDSEIKSVVGLESFSRGISLTSVDILTLLRHRGPHVHGILGEITRLFEEHALKPVHPVNIHSMQDVQTAFKSMQTGEQAGKVVLSARPDEQVQAVPRPKGLTAQHRLRSDASYLIVGGVGGIGRSIAYWLVEHGAKNLILLSRSAGDLDLDEHNTTDGALFVRELRDTGCRIKPVSCDISLASSLAKALRACKDDGLPPVRGIIQGAMLLRDAVFEQMTLEDWRNGLRPKLDGSWNLHTEFSQPDSLDFFVMLSSVSGIVGIASQTNYAAGGSYEDGLARWRQARGLPGVSLDLGPLSDIGYVATAAKVAERLRKDGDFAMLDEAIVLRALNVAVSTPLGGRSQIIVGLNSEPGPQWDATGRSQLGRDSRFLPLKPRKKPRAGSAEGDDSGNGGSISLAAQLSEASTHDEGVVFIGVAIATKLADIFMTPVAEIDLSKPPAHFGVDSLIAVELRNMLVLQAAADISIFNILQTDSLAALAATVAEKSRHLKAAA